ncbi:MAG: alpha/beta hydrolase, partial [Planctomycetales bacterium]|nr:alpha/beta hydrolase [Planctomycetales bacterium]
MTKIGIAIAALAVLALPTCAEDVVDVWPGTAPGETTRSLGEPLPPRPGGKDNITRLAGVTRPTLQVYRPENPNGTAVIILPGGGFTVVVPDLEGSEAAEWLNSLGVTAFVLNYRTKNEPSHVGWRRPVQDIQRAMAVIRSQADRWQLNSDRIGILAFSAGGQVAARFMSDPNTLTYDRVDKVDDTNHRPDFVMMVYPWRMYDPDTDGLIDGINVPPTTPPTFLVHTHDDRSTALGTVM